MVEKVDAVMVRFDDAVVKFDADIARLGVPAILLVWSVPETA